LIAAVLIYAIAYGWIEHRRYRKGPWEIRFTSSAAAGSPLLVVNQPKLGITNVQILFEGEPAPTNSSTVVIFREPKPVPFATPFGQCVFMDMTFLPGTVTLRLYGHEIEFLPRTMILDHEEHAWRSSETIRLPQAQPKTIQ
jgi:hypothetical protein